MPQKPILKVHLDYSPSTQNTIPSLACKWMICTSLPKPSLRASLAPVKYSKHFRPLSNGQRKPDIQIVHYLDDFLVIAANKQQCQEHLDALLTLFSELRVPIANDKTITPAQIITFLGIELDTNTFRARLPQDKLVEYRTALQEYLNSPKTRKKALDSLIGKLSFVASVILVRAILRRLINLSSAVKTPLFNIRLHNWAKADIRAWLTFMEQYNGVTFSDIILKSHLTKSTSSLMHIN